MRIVDLLKKEAVVLNADVSEKEQMLDLLVDLHKKVGNIEDKEAFKAGIMKRESEGPTAIAEGICIPHSKNDAVIKPGIAAITVPGGVAVSYTHLDVYKRQSLYSRKINQRLTE